MPLQSDKVVALRRLIDVRFPAPQRRARRVVSTGVGQIDLVLRGGLVTGTLTEFVSAVPSGGNQLTLGSILLATREARQRVALVDAAGTFDLEAFDDDALAHVVGVRCGSLAESWRAADLAARDPNYSIVVLDVRGFSVRELLRTRDSVWVRLQRAAEQADTAVVVQTDSAVVPNASARLVFSQTLADTSLIEPRARVIESVVAELQRLRAVREAAT
jgi:hypothetical protein